jgi:glycerol-3-phosphate dehydrogenase
MQEKTEIPYHLKLYKKLRNKVFESYPGPLQCRLKANVANLLIAEAKSRNMKVGELIAEKVSAMIIIENMKTIEGYIAENDL